jgi:glycosyltransferase involved in cell wall biosynthesis
MVPSGQSSYSILAPGFAKWWGSDGRALAQALRGLGHNIFDIDAEDYLSLHWNGIAPKLLRRLFSRVWIEDYNRAVLRQAAASAYDFIIVFKGNLLKPETLRRLRESGKALFNFYPDVSFADHGPLIPAALSLYDCVFTTKSYHGGQEIERFGIRDLQHVRHGFDPEVHRPVKLTPELERHYGCDVSFVGCWAPEKESKLSHVLSHSKEISVRVYGSGWKYASSEFKQMIGANLKPGVFGDELAVVYAASKVNLGLLSCSVSERAICDQTTARTFQIPATRSFVLHEDTAEVRSLFAADREVMLFSNNDDLLDKIKLVLKDEGLRMRISEQGFERCQREPYDYTSAATSIVQYFEGRKATCR